MARGQPRHSTIRDSAEVAVWSRWNFPTGNVAMRGHGGQWVAAKNTLQRPFCWTPEKAFYFGGKRFVGLYPCVAFATENFGHVVQQGPDGLVSGKE